ncbi:MAG TPA: sugar ABC transporter permease [Candidatus Bathyarchaeia archaeon]|nr:sugar ABC transporter permease [Candidatus Bathyarchaeia archaeon]
MGLAAPASSGSAALAVARAREHGRRRRRWRAAAIGYLYLAPAAALTAVFVYWPLVASAALSFYDWNLVSPDRVPVGWQNYRDLVHSRAFWLALVNTGEAAIALTVLTVLAPMLLAVLVLRVAPAWRTVYRVVLFSPTVISMAIACAIWLWMFHPLYGVLNTALALVGVAGPAWLSSSDWAIRSIVLVTVWKTFGFNFVIYTAGLLAIPAELYQAARVDGASDRQLFRHITLPLLAPTTLFVLLTTFILGPQNLFVPTQILTQGGPNEASNNVGYLVYQLGFEYFRVGYASAAATLIFLVFLVLTAIQFVLAERRIHYGG